MIRGVLEVRDAVRGRKLTASASVLDAIRQVREVDPALNAVSEVFEAEALERAEDLDRRIAAGEDAGPLAGVSFTVKGNICTRVGRTTAASRILEAHRAPYDATVVDRLQAAGAVCVAKTNLDEFGMGSSTENSAIVGPTRNPWKTTHVPGGSSGGAAALAASTRGMIHLGSDTGGSIRQPASYCGVTGLKPTYGRVSRYGLLAFASSLDQIGMIQSSALECAAALEVIAGKDPMDSTSADVPVPAYVRDLERNVRGLRLGVPREYFSSAIDPEVREQVEKGIDVLRGLGVETREVSLPHTEHANPTYVLISAAEASSNLARYDGVHYGYRAARPRGIQDLYARSRVEGFGPEVKRRIMVGTFVLSAGYHDAFYNKALKVRKLIRRDFETAFREVDAVVSPTSPVTAFPIGSRIDDPLKLYAVDILTVPANLASVPGASFPCGFAGAGLPVGMQIYGRPFEDATVLRLVHAFQLATDHHLKAPGVRAAAAEGLSNG
ncbi:MAG TPA: Asp-tRNA(Asn)/Glu-tRNA(Gln) amidotransferase subunit GatA [Planctomycetota bacterium]|nr:Asp-tRNA(Asn)/Glu-tRNA(Gln) amidotransferase subunit GatA [Planctomycetota bacterium]